MEIKTVRIKLSDKGMPEIPVPLYDPYLKQQIELNPDGIVSEPFASELTKTYACYEKCVKGEVMDKTKYKIKKDYRKTDFLNWFEKLTPDERDELLAHIKTTYGKGNNIATNKGDS